MVSIPPGMTATAKRERKFFGDDKTAAEKFAAGLRAKWAKGVRGTMLDPATSIAAAEAVKILEPLGIGLVEAARMAERQFLTNGKRETFRERWMRYMLAGECHWRPSYATQIGKLDRKLGDAFMDSPVQIMTPEFIRAAVIAGGARSKSNIALIERMISAAMNERGKERRAVNIEIMTAGQCGRMLRACEDKAERMAVALLLFAGIRPSTEDGEISRLDWETIKAGEIYVPHEVSKTGTDRHIPITPRLARLLRDHPKDGPVIPAGWKRKYDRLRKAAEIQGKQDITRHTFASHFLAAFGSDAAKQAMGHTAGSDTLFRRYRRAVTEADGRAFFGMARKPAGE
jgi:integrase